MASETRFVYVYQNIFAKKLWRALGDDATHADRRMILTTCAVCAAPLADDAPAHCVNCQTRYCSDRCLAGDAAEDDVSEAEEVLEDILLRSKRVLGDSHPDTERARKFLEEVRSARAGAAEES